MAHGAALLVESNSSKRSCETGLKLLKRASGLGSNAASKRLAYLYCGKGGVEPNYDIYLSRVVSC